MTLERDSVTLLHLSDTQFGRNHRFGNLRATTEDGKFETLIQRLEIDLATLKKDHGVKPNAIVVTGDLAESGMKSEFDDVLSLLDRLSLCLDVPRQHVAIVPGNHDINRKKCEAYFYDCEGDGGKPNPPFWPKWTPYSNLLSQFYSEVAGAQFTDAFPWTLWKMPELRMVVAGLNSTMAESHLKISHYGHVGEAQLRWFKDALRQFEREKWMVLGLVHHNVWRGGCFNNSRRSARSSFRNDYPPDVQLHYLGFWLAGGIP